ncbi:cytochrome-c peroxidase [Aporhodopirellula aestuarii]|uniref:C-type cytochrome n=1 Tax=Aporhodopirellula aestuarii TaxID=2950107 RepID=A0ABT0U8N3_9BACT|nr:cytochrome c peroxidase [Aporhodopirellula aestuarii]MCM2373280.1 c-type cytochrome [Aporhodopirellula aestuarii]
MNTSLHPVPHPSRFLRSASVALVGMICVAGLGLSFDAPLVSAADAQAGPATATVSLGDPSLTAGIPGEGPLTMEQVKDWFAKPENHAVLDVRLPRGLDAAAGNIFIPEENPMTRAKIELGRQLYFDTRLSSDNTISCASCHAPDQGWGANTQFGVGVRDQTGNRNSPVSFNRILSRHQFHDGRAATLEEQAVGPIANPIEMGNTHEVCVQTLASIPVYQYEFERVFEDGLTIDNVGRALATFERAVVTGPAPYDYYAPLATFEKAFADDLEYLDEEPELAEQYAKLKADAAKNPMSESAIRGMELTFGKANCTACHAGANFTDEQFHNIGVGMDSDDPDLGRYVVTNEDKDRGAFKTPTMRNVTDSAPYMHDGSQKTLEEVIEWYNKGGHPNPWLSDKMKVLNLTDGEKADLVAFMVEGLTSDFPVIETGRLPADK